MTQTVSALDLGLIETVHKPGPVGPDDPDMPTFGMDWTLGVLGL